MSALTGAGLLVRQNLRRDRVFAPVIIAVLVLVTYASAAATPALYHSLADQIAAANAINRQPAIVALYGPILDPYSMGELAMTKMTVLYAALATALFVALVRRHTRMDEEAGRAELVGSSVMGRNAPLAAALSEAVLYAVVLGALNALAALAGGLPVGGSAAFGFVWTATALVGAAVGALACQLAASARTCAAIAAALLGGAYALRAAGDASSGSHWLAWLSPFGWNTQFRAWSEPRWWMVGLYAALIVVFVAGAQALRSRRDLGAGVMSARPGPATGGRRLSGPFGLALRNHRAMLLCWSLAVGGMGVLFGAMAPGLQDMLTSSGAREMMDRLGGALIAAVLMVVGMLITCFAITVIGHEAADEAAGRAEAALATATSRTRWFGSVLAVAAAGSAWLLVVTGVGLWIGDAWAGGTDPSSAVLASFGWVPAVWLVASLASLAVAMAPRFAWLGWALFGTFLTLTLVGELAKLPRGVIRLSPYSAVPVYPAQAWDWTPFVVLTALAAAVAGTAWWRFQLRDVG